MMSDPGLAIEDSGRQERDVVVAPGARKVFYSLNGRKRKTNYTFFRGDNCRFHPNDESFTRPDVIIEHVAQGLMPSEPFIDSDTPIVSFGSCFASHIGRYLDSINYNVETRKDRIAYISKMGDGIVNTFAILQQFEWAWKNKQPHNALWHGYDATELGYDDRVRSKTRRLFDRAQVFIVTLGLSEIWYDEPTGEVFWRAVPYDKFDASRHKFRVASHSENLQNIRRMHALIRSRRPDARIVFTLSPIALTATFRNMPAIVANAASKANLRSALDEFFRGVDDGRTFYFPSYEIALSCFRHPLMEDRKHVHKHILDFNMRCFERYFCKSGLTDADLLGDYRRVQKLDRRVGMLGHWSVQRVLLLWSTPFGAIFPEEPKKLWHDLYFWLRKRFFKDAQAER